MAQNVRGIFRNIDDTLRKDAGCSSELDYVEQTSWILFLKYLDDFDAERGTGQLCRFISEERVGSCAEVGANKVFGRLIFLIDSHPLSEKAFVIQTS